MSTATHAPIPVRALGAPACLAAGLFCAAAGLGLAASGGVDVAGALVVIGMPLLAVGLAVAAVRWTGLDRAACRALGVDEPDLAGTMQALAECARVNASSGPAALARFIGSGDRLLDDGLRLVMAGADARLIRDALERRLDRSVAGAAARGRLLAGAAWVGPTVAIPVLAAAAMAVLRGGEADGVRAVACGAAALAMFPLLMLVSPARAEWQRRTAARAMAGMVVIEGVLGVRRTESPDAVRRRMLAVAAPAAIGPASAAA